MLGRRYATFGGDPGEITTGKTGATTMTNTMSENIEAQIKDLQRQTERAQAENDTDEANKLYQKQLALERMLPGGTDPAVGEGGRTL